MHMAHGLRCQRLRVLRAKKALLQAEIESLSHKDELLLQYLEQRQRSKASSYLLELQHEIEHCSQQYDECLADMRDQSTLLKARLEEYVTAP